MNVLLYYGYRGLGPSEPTVSGEHRFEKISWFGLVCRCGGSK